MKKRIERKRNAFVFPNRSIIGPAIIYTIRVVPYIHKENTAFAAKNNSFFTSYGIMADSAGRQSAPPLLAPAELRRLFSGLQVSREESGGLKIEASPEAAVSLAAVFEGLAQMLRQADRPDGGAS